jgi:hypothetical protein
MKTVKTDVLVKDLKADWRKWTRAEKWAAASFAIATSTVVPAFLFFGQG